MNVDIILFLQNNEFISVKDFKIFSSLKNISFRYVLFCNAFKFDFYQDIFYNHPFVKLFCIYSLKPFHYMCFYLFLQSKTRMSDLYIITDTMSPNVIENIFLQNHQIEATQFLHKKINSSEQLFILSKQYFETFNFRTDINVYLKDCFEWKLLL
jgi:hypothetical protein